MLFHRIMLAGPALAHAAGQHLKRSDILDLSPKAVSKQHSRRAWKRDILDVKLDLQIDLGLWPNTTSRETGDEPAQDEPATNVPAKNETAIDDSCGQTNAAAMNSTDGTVPVGM
jgi:hypothetical protein